MINTTSTPQASYLKSAPNTPAPKSKNNKKLFGVDRKAVLTVIGLTSFLVLTMAGVYIAMLQRASRYTTTPTKPQAAGRQDCSMTFVVGASPADELACTKVAYRDEFGNTAGNYQLVSQQSEFDAGDTVVYQIKVTSSSDPLTFDLKDILSQSGQGYISFVDSSCGTGAYSTSTKTLTCDQSHIDSNNSIIFRVKISDDAPDGTSIINLATVTSGDMSANCSTTITVNNPTEVSECGGSCTNDTECPTGHTCSGSVCVLDQCLNNPSSCESDGCTPIEVGECGDTCSTDDQCPNDHTCNEGTCTLDQCVTDPASCESDGCTPIENVACGDTCGSDGQCPDNHTCDNSKCVYDPCLVTGITCESNRCVIVNPQPTPTPAAPAGCNDTCITNSDCSNSSHICWNGTCRLDLNPNSVTCTNPPASVITTVQQVIQTQTVVTEVPTVVEQPVMPDELPQTGPGDGLMIFGVGAGAVLLGIATMLIIL